MFWEEINVGDMVPKLKKGTISNVHLMRWSAATENWHRIHYDQKFAKEHDQLPDVLIHGSWKQQILTQLVKDWIGIRGWVWKISFQFRGMDLVGDEITACGKVTDKEIVGDICVLKCDIGLRNQRNEINSTGTAICLLATSEDRSIPYPFLPDRELREKLSNRGES